MPGTAWTCSCGKASPINQTTCSGCRLRWDHREAPARTFQRSQSRKREGHPAVKAEPKWPGPYPPAGSVQPVEPKEKPPRQLPQHLRSAPMPSAENASPPWHRKDHHQRPEAHRMHGAESDQFSTSSSAYFPAASAFRQEREDCREETSVQTGARPSVEQPVDPKQAFLLQLQALCQAHPEFVPQELRSALNDSSQGRPLAERVRAQANQLGKIDKRIAAIRVLSEEAMKKWASFEKQIAQHYKDQQHQHRQQLGNLQQELETLRADKHRLKQDLQNVGREVTPPPSRRRSPSPAPTVSSTVEPAGEDAEEADISTQDYPEEKDNSEGMEQDHEKPEVGTPTISVTEEEQERMDAELADQLRLQRSGTSTPAQAFVGQSGDTTPSSPFSASAARQTATPKQVGIKQQNQKDTLNRAKVVNSGEAVVTAKEARAKLLSKSRQITAAREAGAASQEVFPQMEGYQAQA